jgi:hypothetical protein
MYKLHHAAVCLLCACCVVAQVSPEQGQFMSVLVKLLGVKNAIEVRADTRGVPYRKQVSNVVQGVFWFVSL